MAKVLGMLMLVGVGLALPSEKVDPLARPCPSFFATGLSTKPHRSVLESHDDVKMQDCCLS